MTDDHVPRLEEVFLSADERGNPHTRIDAIHGDGTTDGRRDSAADGTTDASADSTADSTTDGSADNTAYSLGNTVRPLLHGMDYFAELARRIGELGEGDRFYFVDWRGDPDQYLNDDHETLLDVLSAALDRGVDVRGLLWRSHWRKFGFHAERAFRLARAIDERGGQCLRDMRVATGGAHHQKFVVLRHRDHPERDIAYVGGIDLCHSRRDDHDHLGDAQPLPIAPAYGPHPAWHDVQVAVTGPAVYDVEFTFRERWEDSLPLTINPGRWLSSLLQGEDQTPEPLGDQWPPPPADRSGDAGDDDHPADVPRGGEAVQVLRTYPAMLPVGFSFAPDGERSIARALLKAIATARRLIYIEDQYLWGEEVGTALADALRAPGAAARDHPADPARPRRGGREDHATAWAAARARPDPGGRRRPGGPLRPHQQHRAADLCPLQGHRRG